MTTSFLCCYTHPSNIPLARKVNSTSRPQTEREQKFAAGYQHPKIFTRSTQCKHQPTPSPRHKLYLHFYTVTYHSLLPLQSCPVKLGRAFPSPMAPRSCSRGHIGYSQSKAQTCKQRAMNGLAVE